MTAHELAQKLLEGPDLPVRLKVGTSDDAFWGEPGDVTITNEDEFVNLDAYQQEDSEL